MILEPHPDTLDSAEEIAEHAVAYARLGVYVFPLHVPVSFGRQGTGRGAAMCTCGGKWSGKTKSRYEPCAAQAKHGLVDHDLAMTGGIHGASNDPELTAARWDRWSPAGIGCDTKRSGLVVVDVDNAAGKDHLRELVATHGPLEAAAALTGRVGGEHHWMKLPPGSYRSGRLGGSLEIKATTCVTLAPSWHPSGARYRWILRDPLVAGGFPPAPPWLVELARRAAPAAGNYTATSDARYPAMAHGTSPALRRLEHLVRAVEEADDGRHDLLVRAWFAAGSFISNGWIEPEWAEHEVLEPLTRSCGPKHANNLSGFRSALQSGLSDPGWARS